MIARSVHHAITDHTMLDASAYMALFLAAFGAATLIPLQSEAAVVAMLLAKQPVAAVITIASIGNVLGSVVNWVLGLYIERLRHRRWFPVDDRAFARAQVWYHRYGKWSLLLSWMPIVGDPLTLVAGVLREPLRVFLPLVIVAKAGRYVVLAILTLGVI
jgi:membrane protein YqaA with SNARE-associated domain